MLTSFFGKSKPINFLLTGLYIFVGFLFYLFLHGLPEGTSVPWWEHLIVLGGCVFTILLLDFILRKNTLTLSNNYAIFLFTGFLVMLPAIFSEKNLVIANVLILLSLRRTFSLSSPKNTNIKILDASLWISLASLFYFWSLLVFIILYVAILKNKTVRFRHLLIPPIGFTAMFVLTTTFYYLKDDSFDWFFEWITAIGLNFSAYNSLSLLLPVALLATLIIWTGISRVSRLPNIPKKDRTNYKLVFYAVYVAVGMALLIPTKTGAELIFVLAPAAIMIANYLEQMDEFWFREILLWVVLLLPILLLVI